MGTGKKLRDQQEQEESRMESMHWLFVSAFIAFAAGLGWLFVIRPVYRVWGSLNDRMADQVTQSAELLRDCDAGGSAPGRLSTIR
jgi:hypothetical protein